MPFGTNRQNHITLKYKKHIKKNMKRLLLGVLLVSILLNAKDFTNSRGRKIWKN